MIRWALVPLSALAIVVAVAGVSIGMYSDDGSGADEGIVWGGEIRYLGVRQLPAYDIPPVTLTDTDGEEFDLAANARGRLLMLYVGYTNCPDACPLHMVELAEALKQLSSKDAERVLVVFVTADPERDTPEVLGSWLANFNTDFVGLTGDQAEVNSIQRSLGLNPASHAANNHGGYNVDHGTMVFAFPPKSQKAELVYPVGTTAAEYAADIKKLLQDGKVQQ